MDHQVGLVQRILCDKVDSAHLNACHLLEGTVCHLLQHCGDDSKRNLVACDYQFDMTAIAPVVMASMSAHKWIWLPMITFGVCVVALAVVPELL